ncbi:MAG: DinB family protein [Alphaproteobacteria bacterium]|nr:DinB family protein [Alphaproteobacteria bacterium]
MIATLIATVGQMSPEDLQYRAPDRDRSMAELGGHIGSIMRSFLHVYDSDVYDSALENPAGTPASGEEIISLAAETQRMTDEWWRRFGFDDPLDRVIETGWGMRTLHEALERSVWHPMQHMRQLTYFAEQLGVTPLRRLLEADLAGLPLPAGIHA